MTHQQHEICQICPSRDTIDGFFGTLPKRRYDSKTTFWPLERRICSTTNKVRSWGSLEKSCQKAVLESYLRLGRVPKKPSIESFDGQI